MNIKFSIPEAQYTELLRIKKEHARICTALKIPPLSMECPEEIRILILQIKGLRKKVDDLEQVNEDLEAELYER